jgi:hypothetical protein
LLNPFLAKSHVITCYLYYMPLLHDAHQCFASAGKHRHWLHPKTQPGIGNGAINPIK